MASRNREPFLKFIPITLILLLLLTTVVACGGGSWAQLKSPPAAAITTGPEVEVATGVIGPTGGTIEVKKPGEPLDGFRLDVPPNAYEQDTSFTLSYAPIESHTFGSDFNPRTPLIHIENGGEFADEFLRVKIPVTVSPDEFAMAVTYDEDAGELEALPPAAYEDGFLTVCTRHFSRIAATAISLAWLPDDIETGFQPGRDDWEFYNRGSYIAPGGHCAGQCVTAMWYFTEKAGNKGAASLYGQYDGDLSSDPSLWQDDNLGYRLASTVQEDMAWEHWSRKVVDAFSNVADVVTWRTIRYAMQLTGKPQLLVVSGTSGVHAIIAYRTSKGTLHVADPNQPGNASLTIPFGYVSFDSYKPPNAEFRNTAYCSVSTIYSWREVGRRWGELDGKTIGSDRFPSYSLAVKWNDAQGAEQTSELCDGWTTDAEKVTVVARYANSPSRENKEKEFRVYVYQNGGWSQGNEAQLDSGPNQLGILIEHYNATNYYYVDFQWVKVQRGETDNGGMKVTRAYYSNGVLEHEFTYYEDENGGMLRGTCTYYYESGKLKAQNNWSNNDLNGWQKDWYENGQLKAEYEYKNGKQTGQYRSYYENGQLEQEGQCSDHERVPGTWKEYNPDGSLKATY